MLKYINSQVVFREFPDEITLAFNISGCKIHCKDCHSKFLWENVGNDLTLENIDKELSNINSAITCLGFMGDPDREALNKLVKQVKSKYNYKIGLYSGYNDFNNLDVNLYDYIKLGNFIKEKGGLDNLNTNQRMYKIGHTTFPSLIDITYKFIK